MVGRVHSGAHGEGSTGAQRSLLGSPSPGLVRLSALALACLLCFGVLTVSATGRWAVSILEAGLFALGAVWAARLAIRPFAIRGSLPAAALAFGAAWPLAQLLTGSSVYRFETWNAALHWAAGLTAFLLALQLFAGQARLHSFLDTLLWFGTAIAAVSLLQLFTSHGRIFWLFPTEYRDLVLGPFVYRNQYAAFVELVIPLALLKALSRPRAALGWYAAAALMAASVVAGASRAGTILVVLETLTVLVLDGRRRGLATLWKLAAVAALLVAIAGPGFLWWRFQHIDPLAVRRELIESSLAMFRERPWMGFGLGTWPTVYPAYARFDIGLFANHAHSDWAEWAAEGGLPFLAAMAAVAGAAFFYSARRRWGIGVAAIFLHALVDYPLQKPALAFLAFTLLGALAAGSGLRYPLITPTGRSRATLRVRPASTTTPITASTSL